MRARTHTHCKLQHILKDVGYIIKNNIVRETEKPLPQLRGLLFSIEARTLLCVLSHRQDNTYHGLWYTNRGELAGTPKVQ